MNPRLSSHHPTLQSRAIVTDTSRLRDHCGLLLFVVAAVWLLIPQLAYATDPAGGPNSVAEVLCTIASWLYGLIGRMIAALAIIAMGLACMFGRVQISSVMTVAAGIAVMMGAPVLVQNLGLNVSCAGFTTVVDAINSPILHILGCVVAWFHGPVGKGVATLTIIAIGLMAQVGRISYHNAIVMVIGIACVFGASTLVRNLTMLEPQTATLISFDLTQACPV
jgi:type IV secretory pathway VirB2 component (pilin)